MPEKERERDVNKQHNLSQFSLLKNIWLTFLHTCKYTHPLPKENYTKSSPVTELGNPFLPHAPSRPWGNRNKILAIKTPIWKWKRWKYKAESDLW